MVQKYYLLIMLNISFCYRLRTISLRRFISRPNLVDEDTIYALSSGQLLQTAVAMIRVSGDDSKKCIELLTKKSMPSPRVATLRKLYCPDTHDILDHALLFWFPGPHSYSGEDIVEFHVHGSRSVVSGIFCAFEKLRSRGLHIRPAEKGEFTMRAYRNGRMGLTEVEGLADLLVADTSEQRKQALQHMEGHARKRYETWR